MRSEFLPFSKPSINDGDIASVSEVLRSGWITTGSRCAEFEQKFSNYIGCENAVSISSATAGMHLAIKALQIGYGDEVITPSMTWVSTINLIVLSGAIPVFVDIDRDTLMVSLETIENHINERTRLIIPVHFAGAPVDMDPIRTLAKKNKIDIIEDAAHAIGTFYYNELIGKSGSAIFSFHPIKNITTGEGGMVCCDDRSFANYIRQLRFHGIGIDDFDKETQVRSPQAQVIEPGFKYNMTDISAALGLSQLSRLNEFNLKRKCLSLYYRELLTEIDEIIPLKDPDYPHGHSWHLFIIRLDIDKAKIDRDQFMLELKRRNIGTGLHFQAVHLQKYYREKMAMRRGLLPNTEWNSDRICSLPLFPDMTLEDINQVVDTIKEVLSNRR